MDNVKTFVHTAEAAFIAGLSDRDMNRVIDEHLVPDNLVRKAGGRSFTRLAAAFARFYFGAEEELVPLFRRNIVNELAHRVEMSKDKDLVIWLDGQARTLIDWHVSTNYAQVDVWKSVEESIRRAQEVKNARAVITSDPEVMGGMLVFNGTCVPIENVLASLDNGLDWQRVVDAYPFLTHALVGAARTYSKVHPRRGRPRQGAGAASGLRVVTRRLVRPATA